jgi:hypothetical protein
MTVKEDPSRARDDNAARDDNQSHFKRNLIRVISIQVIALLLLALVQKIYTP